MKRSRATARFERAARAQARGEYALTLYIAGRTHHSAEALRTVKQLCDEHLGGRYDLEVIDIYQQPALARKEQIVAVPTLIKREPLPPRRLIGDLSSRERVLRALELRGVHGI